MWNSCFAAKEQPSSKQWPKFSHALWPSPLYWLHFIFTWDIALLQWLFMPNYLYICHISVIYLSYIVQCRYLHKCTKHYLYKQTPYRKSNWDPTRLPLGWSNPVGMPSFHWDGNLSRWDPGEYYPSDCVWSFSGFKVEFFKVILYSYLILKKMNERITDS